MPSIKNRHTPLKPGIRQLRRRTTPQSVRTSFRFSEDAGEALAWIAQRLDTTQKDVIRTVVSDLGSLSEDTPRRFSSIARAAREQGRSEGTRRAYVVDRDSLEQLRELAAAANCSRDALLETALRAYFEATAEAEDTLRADRGQALELVQEIHTRAADANKRLGTRLDRDDPIRERFAAIAADLAELEHELTNEIDLSAPVWGGAHADQSNA